MQIQVNHSSKTPLYKQVVQEIKELITKKVWKEGHLLPSMNQLCESLQVSKETVKKAYSILRADGFIDAAHGKGFFVKKIKKQALKVLVLFDVLSFYKKELFESFSEHMDSNTEFTIRLFNQEIDLFEKFILENLGQFDYYVITPHLPLTPKIQARVISILKKIPNRQLVLLDRDLDGLPGNFISIYQDFENDVYEGLQQATEAISRYPKLNIFTMKGSLYGKLLHKGIQHYCEEQKINHAFFDQKIPDKLTAGESYFILSGQLENELIQMARMAKAQKLKIGKDIGILSYNESAINEIILNGLSVLSTDFKEMGKEAAIAIKEDKHRKTKCVFRFIKRNTF
ncbi:GntR family transcriptional regulator [Sphingobacterium paucimobilis]|uniref:HTH gntR-type domain-containing protein n=1 Tax=Sphingobacterium paucimobilis HER1398 TaxID=1346330 RepID=U2I0J6_9SPHI|nr:GntR family transcriptional regulator [Sphingobacterium paucimobilis]ERJ61327.1 hypothetical protein M472_21465 [Sphingobacterium paucimobilis HER1398]